MNTNDINITNFYKFSEFLKDLLKNNELSEYENFILKIIQVNEENSICTGQGVAPGYYFDLAKLYRKLKRTVDEENILYRYLIQVKSRGQQPKKILERYFDLKKTSNREIIQGAIYYDYLKNIEKINQQKITTICPLCKKEIILIVPNTSIAFGTCCPLCAEDFVIG